jgi:hypothetical protein
MRCRVDRFWSCATAAVANSVDTANVTAEILVMLTEFP